MKDWKTIAAASGTGIPDPERFTEALDSLEQAFRPLTKSIPHDGDPAFVFHPETEGGE